MIDREFIEKIEDMTGPKVIETDHGAFSDKQLHRIEDRLIDTTKLSSLSGLVTMMKQEMEMDSDKDILTREIIVTGNEWYAVKNFHGKISAQDKKIAFLTTTVSY